MVQIHLFFYRKIEKTLYSFQHQQRRTNIYSINNQRCDIETHLQLFIFTI